MPRRETQGRLYAVLNLVYNYVEYRDVLRGLQVCRRLRRELPGSLTRITATHMKQAGLQYMSRTFRLLEELVIVQDPPGPRTPTESEEGDEDEWRFYDSRERDQEHEECFWESCQLDFSRVRFHCLHRLALKRCPLVSMNFNTRNTPMLTHLRVCDNQGPDAQALRLNLPELRHLKLEGVILFTTTGFTKSLSTCSRLVSVEVDDVRGHGSLRRVLDLDLPNCQLLLIRECGINGIRLAAPKLRILDLSGNPHLQEIQIQPRSGPALLVDIRGSPISSPEIAPHLQQHPRVGRARVLNVESNGCWEWAPLPAGCQQPRTAADVARSAALGMDWEPAGWAEKPGRGGRRRSASSWTLTEMCEWEEHFLRGEEWWAPNRDEEREEDIEGEEGEEGEEYTDGEGWGEYDGEEEGEDEGEEVGGEGEEEGAVGGSRQVHAVAAAEQDNRTLQLAPLRPPGQLAWGAQPPALSCNDARPPAAAFAATAVCGSGSLMPAAGGGYGGPVPALPNQMMVLQGPAGNGARLLMGNGAMAGGGMAAGPLLQLDASHRPVAPTSWPMPHRLARALAAGQDPSAQHCHPGAMMAPVSAAPGAWLAGGAVQVPSMGAASASGTAAVGRHGEGTGRPVLGPLQQQLQLSLQQHHPQHPQPLGCAALAPISKPRAAIAVEGSAQQQIQWQQRQKQQQRDQVDMPAPRSTEQHQWRILGHQQAERQQQQAGIVRRERSATVPREAAGQAQLHTGLEVAPESQLQLQQQQRGKMSLTDQRWQQQRDAMAIAARERQPQMPSDGRGQQPSEVTDDTQRKRRAPSSAALRPHPRQRAHATATPPTPQQLLPQGAAPANIAHPQPPSRGPPPQPSVNTAALRAARFLPQQQPSAAEAMATAMAGMVGVMGAFAAASTHMIAGMAAMQRQQRNREGEGEQTAVPLAAAAALGAANPAGTDPANGLGVAAGGLLEPELDAGGGIGGGGGQLPAALHVAMAQARQIMAVAQRVVAQVEGLGMGGQQRHE
ncbi:hypothetical protein PLESTB_000957800 [Pleodorina starrii]|uniref:Uncharacterized protein n=1 Tax=Pleodorina starrii TaxID=330485 RepID=A0A9W6C3I5_9CHLO|nr:hypothetical protein PLESTM_001140400 [Pleodorina starrii]GLC77825.1 hypothetical protein PLESTB_000957800 [Pleodorina starrii]